MLPSIFSENLFDDLFDDAFDRNFFSGRNPLYGKHARNLMKTDVQESDTGYTLEIDLPAPLNAIKKGIIKAIKGTDIEKVLRDHNVLKDYM